MSVNKEKKSFKHIGALVQSSRVSHKSSYSQFALSKVLGYKNGQFISNIERGLCNIPLKKLSKICKVLDISHGDLKEAILKDCEEDLISHLELE